MTQLVHFATMSGHTELESPMIFCRYTESGIAEFMGDMRFSRAWYSWIRRRIVWYIGVVSEEPAGITFSVDE
jgi:hypothetical protein